jgi:hypothetical protein
MKEPFSVFVINDFGRKETSVFVPLKQRMLCTTYVLFIFLLMIYFSLSIMHFKSILQKKHHCYDFLKTLAGIEPGYAVPQADVMSNAPRRQGTLYFHLTTSKLPTVNMWTLKCRHHLFNYPNLT